MLRSEKTVLCIEAHPDDAEFLCAGTLALLRERGWQVHIASVTPGDCGTVQYSREEISRIRKVGGRQGRGDARRRLLTASKPTTPSSCTTARR